MPHFFALAWMYREDYARAGFRHAVGRDETGLRRPASQSVLFCILLLLIAGVTPVWFGLTSLVYLPIALALSGWFRRLAMRFHRQSERRKTRAQLFLTSIIYLPLLLGALVLTKQ